MRGRNQCWFSDAYVGWGVQRNQWRYRITLKISWNNLLAWTTAKNTFCCWELTRVWLHFLRVSEIEINVEYIWSLHGDRDEYYIHLYFCVWIFGFIESISKHMPLPNIKKYGWKHSYFVHCSIHRPSRSPTVAFTVETAVTCCVEKSIATFGGCWRNLVPEFTCWFHFVIRLTYSDELLQYNTPFAEQFIYNLNPSTRILRKIRFFTLEQTAFTLPHLNDIIAAPLTILRDDK